MIQIKMSFYLIGFGDRMIETTMRDHNAFTWKQYCRIVNDIIYCCADRSLAVRLLHYLRTAGTNHTAFSVNYNISCVFEEPNGQRLAYA